MNELKIQKKLREFAKHRDWEQFHSLKNLAISISIEASELMEIFQWEEKKSNFWLEKKSAKLIEEEVADVMLYLLRFADIAKIDIEKVCINKIKVNAKKYPVRKSKGRSTKYNKL
ncbi:MAG: nucleotide pyrophosphohydrolase [Alphaproteobacteria bacterium]